MEEVDLRKLLAYLKSKVIIFIILLILIFGFMYFILYKKTETYYVLNTKVILSENREKSVSDNNFMDTYIQLMTSNNVLQQVIDNIELNEELKTFKERLKISKLNSSYIIRINYKDEKEENVELVLQELIKVSKKEINDVYNNDVNFILDTPDEIELETNYSTAKKCFLSAFVSAIVSFVILFSSYILKESKINKEN